MDGVRVDSDASWKGRYERLVRWAETNFGAKVKYKNESWLMRNVVKRAAFFNKDFMTGYTTVLYRTIWFPSRDSVSEDYAGAFKTLAHELVHVSRGGRNVFHWLWFAAKYMSPALPMALLAAVLLALSIVVTPWLYIGCAVALFLAVFPLPAPYRVEEEAYGYAMSIACDWWCLGQPYKGEECQAWVLQQFTGPGYWFMYQGDTRELSRRLTGIAERYEVDDGDILPVVVRLLAVYGPAEFDAAVGQGKLKCAPARG